MEHNIKPEGSYNEDLLSTDELIGRDIWKAQVNLYHFIQQRCDRPAYFWYNYRFVGYAQNLDNVPFDGLTIPRQLELLPSLMTRHYINKISNGELDPQEWCDTH